MKNLKKIIAMGLTAALCAVSLAGCGGSQIGGADGERERTGPGGKACGSAYH